MVPTSPAPDDLASPIERLIQLRRIPDQSIVYYSLLQSVATIAIAIAFIVSTYVAKPGVVWEGYLYLMHAPGWPWLMGVLNLIIGICTLTADVFKTRDAFRIAAHLGHASFWLSYAAALLTGTLDFGGPLWPSVLAAIHGGSGLIQAGYTWRVRRL